MLTLTANTFENIDKKFHNDPRKTLGDMYIFSGGDLLLLHCLSPENAHVSNNNGYKKEESDPMGSTPPPVSAPAPIQKGNGTTGKKTR